MFIKRLTELLKEKNITITQLAEKTGIPRSTISSYINNRKSVPSATQLIQIATFLNVTIDFLVGREDDFGNVNVTNELSPAEQRLLKAFNSLSDVAKEKLIEDAEFYAGSVTLAQKIKKQN